ADAVEAQCKRFEVSSSEDGRVLFSADEEEIVIGADRLKVTGSHLTKSCAKEDLAHFTILELVSPNEGAREQDVKPCGPQIIAQHSYHHSTPELGDDNDAITGITRMSSCSSIGVLINDSGPEHGPRSLKPTIGEATVNLLLCGIHDLAQDVLLN
ncbi:hypothetical protein lerEdw1_014131, partial [Lerista edwardsae]